MKLLNRIIGFTALSLAALLVTGCGEPASQMVNTQSGPVQGVTNEGVAIFRGIPYASATIRRFTMGRASTRAALDRTFNRRRLWSQLLAAYGYW